MSVINEIKEDFLKDLHLNEDREFKSLENMVKGDSKYVKDLRINLKNVLNSDFLSAKEALLIALAVAVNERCEPLIYSFETRAKEEGATDEEIAEVHSCASLLAVNNIFYRFRHFAQKDIYNSRPARIKMSIMMRPVLGKEFFELMSLAVSAVNGCEMCVRSHEQSVLQLDSSEERIFDAVRIAAIVTGVSKVVH